MARTGLNGICSLLNVREETLSLLPIVRLTTSISSLAIN